MQDRYDLLIKNGFIVDGTGGSIFRADIGVVDGKIAEVKDSIDKSAIMVIDASGLHVSPGFIDTHSHTDDILPFESSVDSFVQQGITTCVVGMCGASIAPINPDKIEEFKLELGKFMPPFKEYDIPWRTFGEYLDEMERLHCPINLVFFVGYDAIRMAGGAGSDNRLPTSEELSAMKEYITEAMESGAFGMSTGLIYAPQVYAETSELVELSKIVGKYGGLYFSHIRGEAETVFNAINEVIEIVEKSGCRGGQIAHHKIADKKLWGASTKTLKMIEDANSRGVSITCDSYPYDRGLSSLVTALPPWVLDGGSEMILERLRDPKIRERIRNEIEENINEDETAVWENWIKTDGFHNIFVVSVTSEKWKDVFGLSITDIAKKRSASDEYEIFFDLILDSDASVLITMKSMDEGDVSNIMTSPYHMFGTDGAGVPKGYKYGFDHPRSFGTFPRVLGKYVREDGVLTLEKAIAKMTSIPAKRLGLENRGVVKENAWADLVVFDANTIIDKATYTNPHQFPDGISHVIVNGRIVVDNGQQYDVDTGVVIRMKSKE
ncbi:MAG: N-acyl-D-amino-acid deacylase family protein [Candidatus Thorarchaeota archaeon]